MALWLLVDTDWSHQNNMDKPPLLLFVMVMLFFPLFVSEQSHTSMGFTSALPQKSLRDYPGALEWALDVGLIEENSLAYKIIDCESKWRPEVCNYDYGCRAGIGLWQIVVSTWNETIVKMARNDIDMPERCWQFMKHPISYERREIIFDGECNLLVGRWLLENEGNKHWKQSEHCWTQD